MLNGKDVNNISVDRYDGAVVVSTLRNINERTITGATETTMIPTSIRGTKTIRTEQFEVGRTYKVFGYALLTTGVSQSGTIRVKIGATTIIADTATFQNSLTSARATFEVIMTITAVGASGEVRLSGTTLIQTATGISTPLLRGFITASDITIDTTANRDIDVTYQFGATGNTLQIREFNIEQL